MGHNKLALLYFPLTYAVMKIKELVRCKCLNGRCIKGVLLPSQASLVARSENHIQCQKTATRLVRLDPGLEEA